jgi:hypothetical protein
MSYFLEKGLFCWGCHAKTLGSTDYIYGQNKVFKSTFPLYNAESILPKQEFTLYVNCCSFDLFCRAEIKTPITPNSNSLLYLGVSWKDMYMFLKFYLFRVFFISMSYILIINLSNHITLVLVRTTNPLNLFSPAMKLYPL